MIWVKQPREIISGVNSRRRHCKLSRMNQSSKVIVGRIIAGVASCAIFAMAGGCASNKPASASENSPTAERFYIGTFTPGTGMETTATSKGIYMASLDTATGKVSEPKLVAEAVSPSFLALNPNHRFLYSVNEIDQLPNSKFGGVSAYSIDTATGALTFVNQQPSGGRGPTHIWIDKDGKDVFVANYASGAVAELPVKADGSLDAPSSIDQHQGKGADPDRQSGPHAHSVYVDPGNKFLLSCDLGLDKVFVYQLDPEHNQFKPAETATAAIADKSGPRHLAFDPSGKHAYVVSEMACTVTAFNYNAVNGALSEIQTISTLPDDFKGQKSTAEIRMHPSGKFLYNSNRGDANSITVYSVDPDSGKLTFVDRTGTQGRTPRGFNIDPTGNWLIAGNQDTNTIAVYRIDTDTGKLQATGQVIPVPTPVDVLFAGK
jgi:6-phosphogluconolactonase